MSCFKIHAKSASTFSLRIVGSMRDCSVRWCIVSMHVLTYSSQGSLYLLNSLRLFGQEIALTDGNLP